MTFPDIEKALIVGIPVALAARGFEGVTAKDTVPADSALASLLSAGFVRVQLINDPDDFFTRFAEVNIECFASTRSVAYDVSEEIRDVLLSSRNLGGVVMDRIETTSGPKRVPWDNSNVRRFLSTYKIHTRR